MEDITIMCGFAFVYWNAFGVQTQYVCVWKCPPVHNAEAEFCSAINRRGLPEKYQSWDWSAVVESW